MMSRFESPVERHRFLLKDILVLTAFLAVIYGFNLGGHPLGDTAAYALVMDALLGPGFKGLLLTAFLAAFMSTIDTHVNLAVANSTHRLEIVARKQDGFTLRNGYPAYYITVQRAYDANTVSILDEVNLAIDELNAGPLAEAGLESAHTGRVGHQYPGWPKDGVNDVPGFQLELLHRPRQFRVPRDRPLGGGTFGRAIQPCRCLPPCAASQVWHWATPLAQSFATPG